jgi:hypothetical protein
MDASIGVEPNAIAEPYMPAVWPLEAAQTPEERGLARAGRAEKDRDLWVFNRMLPAADECGGAMTRAVAPRVRVAELDVDVEQGHSDSVRRCNE